MKFRIILFTAVLIIMINSGFIQAQGGESAVPFLIVPASAEISGMGYASVALPSDDPLISTFNPAHLGIQSLKNNLSFGYNHSNWFPSFHIKDFGITTYALNGGINLNKYFNKLPPLSVGLGYSHVLFNFGAFAVGNVPGNKTESYDKYDQLTFSLALDYYIRASFGAAYKHVYSKLGGNVVVGNMSGEAKAEADLLDWGAFIELPVVPLISKSLNRSMEIYEGFTPVLNFSFAFSKSNMGQNSIYYVNPAQAGPLPRIARAGLGISAGFELAYNDIVMRWVSFNWTIEANDNLIDMNYLTPWPTWEYQSGLGDINFFKELILGKTNQKTEKLKGWQVNFSEMFSIYGGRFEEDYYNGGRKFNTSGWSIRTLGLIKLLKAVKPEILNKGVLGYILTHFDFRYGVSTLKTDNITNPLNNSDYNSFNIIFTN